jgi:hypothetical protein
MKTIIDRAHKVKISDLRPHETFSLPYEIIPYIKIDNRSPFLQVKNGFCYSLHKGMITEHKNDDIGLIVDITWSD